MTNSDEKGLAQGPACWIAADGKEFLDHRIGRNGRAVIEVCRAAAENCDRNSSRID